MSTKIPGFVPIGKIIGKTVKGVTHNDGYAIISFDDQTHTAFLVDGSSDYPTIINDSISVTTGVSEKNLVSAGVCSHEEFSHYQACYRAEVETRQKNSRRQQYERLKGEFEQIRKEFESS
jgi:hypothetical protein